MIEFKKMGADAVFAPYASVSVLNLILTARPLDVDEQWSDVPLYAD